MTGAPWDVGNWFVRYADEVYTVGAAVESSGKVRLSVSNPIADVGADVVSFSPPPFDVVSVGGLLPAAAFADYPIT